MPLEEYMEFWMNLLSWADTKTDTKPQAFQSFHLVSVLFIIAATVLFCVAFKNAGDRTVRVVCLALWAVMLLFEVYKQLVLTYDVIDGHIVGNYNWFYFPFQLCSTPIYVLPFVVFLPDGRVRDALISFMIAFSTFGGLAVCAYPGVVFTATVGINYQTMVHHGIQVVVGAMLAAKYRDRLNIRFFLRGAVVFCALLCCAMAINTIIPALNPSGIINQNFSMFYIGFTQENCELPILNMIYPAVPYLVFLAIYIVGFLLVAALIFYIAKGIVILSRAIGKACLKNAA